MDTAIASRVAAGIGIGIVPSSLDFFEYVNICCGYQRAGFIYVKILFIKAKKQTPDN